MVDPVVICDFLGCDVTLDTITHEPVVANIDIVLPTNAKLLENEVKHPVAPLVDVVVIEGMAVVVNLK